MRKTLLRQMALICLCSSLFVFGWASIQAQAVNLLANPGFESPYSDAGGEPPRQVAQGWTPWHVPRTDAMPDFQNSQPEYAPAAPDAPRIRSGTNAQKYGSFFETHDGGVFQRVTGITPRTELRFSVYAYVWSTTFEDRALSEEDGDVLLQVGIDPTGGTDGESDNIVWSTAIEQYDAYREYSVIAAARGSAVTVFVRSTVGVPVRHSDIYLDDAVLAPTTGAAETPAATDTVAPPTSTATNTVAPTNTTVPTVATAAATQVTQSPATATTAPTATFTLPPSATPVPPTPTPEGALPTSTPLTVATATPIVVATEVPISETFPGTIVHTVRRGDTVGNLATLYNSSIQAIIEANGLGSSALIIVGQGLVIPVRLAAPSTSTPTATPLVLVVTATAVSGGGPVSGGPVAPGEEVYVVRPGDTLFRIATRYNTTVAALAQLNGIVNANRIQVGQTLRVPAPGGVVLPPSPTAVVVLPATATPIPGVTTVPPTAVPPTPVPGQPTTYVVRPGDNLFRISLRYNVTMASLIRLNGIANPNLIFIGQVLTIP